MREGGEDSHHRWAPVVEEEHPAVLGDAHHAAAVFGVEVRAEEAAANGCFPAIPRGPPTPWLK